MSKADSSAAPPPPLRDCITRINSNCSHHTMFTICTLFSTLTTKHRVCVKGASKQTSNPIGTAPPGFEIPGSATGPCHRFH